MLIELLVTVALVVLLVAAPGWSADNQSAVAKDQAKPSPAVFLVSVPLPLVGTADERFMATVDKWLESVASSPVRPILVLEFRMPKDRASSATRFERAVGLARYLTGPKFRRVRTVAFLPTSIEGHAVLPVLACEEIMMAPGAELGAAGQGEPAIDETMRSAYREIAERRGTIPVPVVMGMLDPAVEVTEVQRVGGG